MARLTASGASSTRLHTAQLTPWKTLPQGRNEHHQKTSQPGARRAVKLYPEPKKHTEGMGTQEYATIDNLGNATANVDIQTVRPLRRPRILQAPA